jgi:hypothetical protein
MPRVGAARTSDPSDEGAFYEPKREFALRDRLR